MKTKTKLDPAIRNLKIEAAGDFWKGSFKSKIRLMGGWLERAGFKPGNRVSVRSVAPGVIELRSIDAPLVQSAAERSKDSPASQISIPYTNWSHCPPHSFSAGNGSAPADQPKQKHEYT
jgi:hypothetical protein